MRRFAENTDVSVGKSRGEIDDLLRRWGEIIDGVATVGDTPLTVWLDEQDERVTRAIVSALVLAACDDPRLVAPDTGPESAIRDAEGRIVAVQGWVAR